MDNIDAFKSFIELLVPVVAFVPSLCLVPVRSQDPVPWSRVWEATAVGSLASVEAAQRDVRATDGTAPDREVQSCKLPRFENSRNITAVVDART